MKKSPTINPDQEIIDRMIEWRRVNRPNDVSPLKTSLDAASLHKCLGVPLPPPAKKKTCRRASITAAIR